MLKFIDNVYLLIGGIIITVALFIGVFIYPTIATIIILLVLLGLFANELEKFGIQQWIDKKYVKTMQNSPNINALRKAFKAIK